MKAFDIEAAKNGAAVVTREGKPARIICYNRKYPGYPIVALVGKDEGLYCDYSVNGELTKGVENGNDLFLATEHHEGWINLYRLSDGRKGGIYVFPTEEEAKQNISKDKDFIYLATVHVEWEE